MSEVSLPKKKSALKGKGGLVMLAASVLLGLWLFADIKLMPKPRDPDSSPPISDYTRVTSGDVTRVEVKRKDGGFVLANRNGQWAFESPAGYRANEESVKSWLKGLLEDG